MTIFGKPLSEYVAFAKVILVLIVIVGVARLALSLAGVGNPTVKWLSISIVTLVGVVYYSIRVYTSGFGSYKELLALIVVQSVVAQTIIIAGIVIAILTGRDNIFSAPEYSPTADGKTWLHAGMHLVLGVIVGSLLAWLIGSVILFVTKFIIRREGAAVATPSGSIASLAAGTFLGGLIGFLLRPSIPLIDRQLPFGDVITRGASLEGVDRMLVGLAEKSFNYLIAGAIIGAAIGFGAHYLVSMRKDHDALRGTQSAPNPQATPQADVSESIRKLSELKDKGILTEEEFQVKKKELLDRL